MLEERELGTRGDLLEANGEAEQVITLAVEGMSCNGCATSLSHGLGRLQGVTGVEVDLEHDEVTLRGLRAELEAGAARQAVEDLGYSVRDEATESTPRDAPRLSLAELLIAALLVIVGGTLLFNLGVDSYRGGGALSDARETFAEVSAVGIGLGFAFGLIMAFAPVTYAMAPAVMGFVTKSGARSTAEAARLSAAFVAGIVAIDVVLGAVFAAGGSVAISSFSGKLPLWYLLASVLLVALALLNLRVWRPRLPSYTPRLGEPRSGVSAFFLGVPFGLMACPGCTPLLLPLAVGVAATGNVFYGAVVMGAFALGRGIPLALLGTLTGAFERALPARRLVQWVERVVGLLLLLGAAWFFAKFLDMGGLGSL